MGEENAKNPDFEEIHELLDSDLLQIDEEPLPASAEAIAVNKVLETNHETAGIPDALLRKPYSELNITPDNMEIYAGGENGAMTSIGDEVNIAAFTNIGYGYNRNDDGLLVDTNSNTVVVPDGVGGNKHGEVASNVACHVSGQMLDRPDLVKLEDMIQGAHHDVKEYQKNNGDEYDNIAATFVAARIKNGKAEFVHAGDSKALMFRGDEIIYESSDDNLLNYIMVRLGKTENEAIEYIYDVYGDNARPDAILQDLGHPDPVTDFKTGSSNNGDLNPHYHIEDTKPGDIIVLASDGLTDNMDTETIMKFINERLAKGVALNVIANEIKKEVIAIMKSGTGKFDNITIAIIQVK